MRQLAMNFDPRHHDCSELSFLDSLWGLSEKSKEHQERTDAKKAKIKEVSETG